MAINVIVWFSVCLSMILMIIFDNYQYLNLITIFFGLLISLQVICFVLAIKMSALISVECEHHIKMASNTKRFEDKKYLFCFRVLTFSTLLALVGYDFMVVSYVLSSLMIYISSKIYLKSYNEAMQQ